MTPKSGTSQGGRFEDSRLLSGRGRYTDDTAAADSLVAIFLRAPVAHATISLDGLEEARTMPGVADILTAAEIRAEGIDPDLPATLVKGGASPLRPALAEGRVRHVGEAIACVVATSRAAALDAAEAIALDFEELPAKLDLAEGGACLHEEAPGNRAYTFRAGAWDAADAGLETAAHRLSFEIADHRVICNPMEPRAAWAEWTEGRLHVCCGGQNVWWLKSRLAAWFSVPESQVRVTIPDVGGGFGTRAMFYPEYPVLALAARRLGRPVRWASDRSETMLTDAGARDLVSTVEMGFDAQKRLTAYRVRNLSNLGAYNSQFGQGIQCGNFARVLTGVYDVQDAAMETVGIYTNTTPTDAYRGAGRPEAIYALERAMDQAARVFGEDPASFRRRSMIRPGQLPYATATGESYDVGDFPGVLDALCSKADMGGFAARRAASEAKGKLRGIGLVSYVEAILGAPDETTTVEFTQEGRVRLYVGTQSAGQGHETVHPRLLEARTGIPAHAVDVVMGDSDLIAKGGGTGGSRSVTVQAMVTDRAGQMMEAAFASFLAAELGVPEDALTFEDGRFRAEGTNAAPDFMEAARMAHDAGRGDLLKHTATATLPGRSFPNGAHAAEVEVDPETGDVSLLSYKVVDDFGTLIDPVLAIGQVHGGVAQGVGQALMERAAHDEEGQALAVTFMDYAMPRAYDLPMIEFSQRPIPSPRNPVGMKGCGEAGTVGAIAAVSNAVQDALWARGVRNAQMPFTASRVWAMLRDAAGRDPA
ncbi:xanthine dehydrogenase family protein molybdopterin-binding subunit [Roseicyclus sp. F158]|uniref:Xanthine dehydrogenase family protein molybdopterin-binding subunit n=1 Tax=Tropicimonas omnivorans TaxID=3075590 RepID=A0ABU3DGI3_9RHOB|nr:xanthine dehydrogenase family protein molybdopterin-binding subunit [Roseicyclus sp. F158]MDT0682804.1 xanthine dehydrogenase family protein molybdopterin-binding subunit [Roseicyclus sp. F158]